MKQKNTLNFFLAAVFVFGTLTINAQNKIYVYKTDGTAVEYQIADLDSIAFTLPAPFNLTAVAASTSQINLSWTNNTTGATGIKVEYSPNGTTGWSNIASLAGTATSYQHTGLTGGTTCYYRVYAYEGSNNSSYSNVASATTTTCTPETDTQFCVRMAGQGKVCGIITAPNNCGVTKTVNCGTSACTGATSYCDQSTNTCVSPPPANNLCTGAIALALNTPVVGTTVSATADYGDILSASCYASAYYHGKGPEVVYSFTPTSSKSYTVKVTPSAGYDPLLWISTGSCGNGSDCVYAVDAGGTSNVEQITFNGVAGTTYYIYVDSYSETAASRYGTFTIEVKPVCAVSPNYGTITPIDAYADSYSGDVVGGFLLNSNGDEVHIELYNNEGVFTGGSVRTGTFALTGAEIQYSTCGACVRLFEGGSSRNFLATGGTLTLTSVSGNLTGTLTNVTFVEVTIASGFVSTPVPGGCTSAITSMSFSTPIIVVY